MGAEPVVRMMKEMSVILVALTLGISGHGNATASTSAETRGSHVGAHQIPLESGGDSVPVETLYKVTLGLGAAQDVIGAVHAVRRVPGATIVYASHSLSEYNKESGKQQLEPMDFLGESAGYMSSAMLFLPENGEYYFPLRGEDGKCLCPNSGAVSLLREDVSDYNDTGSFDDGVWSFAIAFPPLPVDIDKVDLSIPGNGQMLRDMPIGEGPLEPMSHVPDEYIPDLFKYLQRVETNGWPFIPDEGYFARTEEPSASTELGVDPYTPLRGKVIEYMGQAEKGLGVREDAAGADYTLAADVAFDFDSSNLTPTAEEVIQDVSNRIGQENSTKVKVVGHTDDQGSDEYNIKLSKDRAQAVMDRLKTAHPQVEFNAEGVGESQPVADNSTDLGRSRNRRVVIEVISE